LKYAVVILVVLLGVWLWRKNRHEDAKEARSDRAKGNAKPPNRNSSSEPVQIMLSCALCGVHLPQSEAIAGQRGNYCSLAHRVKKEG
jgi:uncharacterized protein